MPRIRAGQLRHRVAIQTLTETVTAGGDITEAWATSATRWAKVEPLDGSEKYEAGAQQQRLTHKVTMRFYDGLSADHRLLYDSRVLNIAEPPTNTEERDRMTVAMCVEDTDG